MSHGGGHLPNLAVSSLSNGDPKPSRWNALSKADRHRAGSQGRLTLEPLDLNGQGPAALNLEAAAKLPEGRLIRNSLDLDKVAARVRIPRVQEAMGQISVIGQQEKPLAVGVQPADRVNTGDRNKPFQGGPPTRVRELGQNAVGFVKQDVAKTWGTRNRHLKSTLFSRS